MTKTAVNNAQAVLEMGVEKEEMEKAQNIYFLSPCLHKVLQSPVQPAAKKYAIILGNEVKGVQQEVVDQCDGCIEIPQFGTKHSLNVSVTAGILVWEFARKMKL